jgi:hypothetical protein
MVDLELSDTEQVERIFQNQNYKLETQMINIEELMQPVLPPINKRQTVPAYKTGLDKSVLEEIHNAGMHNTQWDAGKMCKMHKSSHSIIPTQVTQSSPPSLMLLSTW